MPERPDSDREVLTSLPRSRPVRRSSKRGERGADGAARPSAKPAEPRKPRAAKAAAKPAAVTPARAAGPRAARPRAKPQATPKAPPKTTPKATPAAEQPTRPVRPHVAPQRKIPAAGYAAPDTRGGDSAASPAAELITTTIQAAAELAQIGMTVGRQTLQSMLERLPKP